MPSLTYVELAEALKITPASANKLARRRRWLRLMGNDGRARVSVPDEALVRPDSTQDMPPDVPPVRPPDKDEPLIKALEAHVETLKERLAAADDALTAERAKTAQAIAAFASLADRLDAMAAERAKPWWRRFTG